MKKVIASLIALFGVFSAAGCGQEPKIKIEYVDRIIEIEKEIVVEKEVITEIEVPIEIIVEKEVVVEKEIIVEKEVPVEIEIEKEVIVEKVIEVEKEVIVEKEIEKIIYKQPQINFIADKYLTIKKGDRLTNVMIYDGGYSGAIGYEIAYPIFKETLTHYEGYKNGNKDLPYGSVCDICRIKMTYHSKAGNGSTRNIAKDLYDAAPWALGDVIISGVVSDAYYSNTYYGGVRQYIIEIDVYEHNTVSEFLTGVSIKKWE